MRCGARPATAARLSAVSVVVGLVDLELVRSVLLPAMLTATGGMLSSRSSNGTPSLASVRTKASGRPFRSVIRWRFVPRLPLSIGFDPVLSSPFGGDGSAVHAGPGPIDPGSCS